MLDRGTARVALIVLIAFGVVQLLAGVLAGLRQDWIGMTIYLVGAVLTVVILTSIPVALKTDNCFNRLEDLISEKSCSVRPITTASNRKGVRKLNKVIEKIILIFTVISVPVHLSLAIFAGLCQFWFRLGIHLAACTITVVICLGVLMALKIDACTRRLEELISRRNEGKASKELSGG